MRQIGADIYGVDINTFVHLPCNFCCVPPLNLSFQKLLCSTVDCEVEWLEVVCHSGWDEDANTVIIGNSIVDTICLLPFKYIEDKHGFLVVSEFKFLLFLCNKREYNLL